MTFADIGSLMGVLVAVLIAFAFDRHLSAQTEQPDFIRPGNSVEAALRLLAFGLFLSTGFLGEPLEVLAIPVAIALMGAAAAPAIKRHRDRSEVRLPIPITVFYVYLPSRLAEAARMLGIPVAFLFLVGVGLLLLGALVG